MVRRIDEPIEVRLAAPRTRGPEGSPAAFRWRGRAYAVTAVEGHWRERRPWWRADRAVLADSDRRVWRVLARPHGGSPGVYEVGCDGPANSGPWLLLRRHD